MDSSRRCRLAGSNAAPPGLPKPRAPIAERIDREALFAALVRAGQPLCVEHALQMRRAALKAQQNRSRIRGPGRMVRQGARAVVLALAHAIVQSFQ